jgi:hypothetical protein
MSECFQVKFSFSGFIVLKNNIFTWPYPFLTFLWLSPLWRGLGPFFFNKLEFSSPKDNLYQVWLVLACRFWRRRFLKNFCVFLLFRDYLPLESDNPLPLKTLESSLSKDDLCQVWLKLAQWFWRKIFLICTKFAWIWPGSGEKIFFKKSSAFSLFHYYLPLERGYPLSLNKLISPLPKDDLCQFKSG